MPEGDTILRTARSLAEWLEGRQVTAARSRTTKAPLERVVGRRVESVEARAKHLLIRFDDGHVLHSHMRMTGSWHRYTRGEQWQKPEWRAAAVLEAGDHVAVCFDAPLVELIDERGVARHRAISGLGPDVLSPPIDLAEVRRRAAARPPDDTIGDLLLDQRVVSGIGNIWRCEVLFVRRVHPDRPREDVSDDELDMLVTEAGRLMSAGRGTRWVYGRAGRPCRRCGAAVAVKRSGWQARNVYWCPGCQR